MTRRRPLPPSYFAVALILMVVLHFLVPIMRLLQSPWTYLGLVPTAIGGWLGAAGSTAFDRAGTTIKLFEESTTLVISGPYRYSRNPMYLGMVSILVGVGVLLGTLSPLSSYRHSSC